MPHPKPESTRSEADRRQSMNDSHPLLPAPRPPSIFLPASYSSAPGYPPITAPDFSLPANSASVAGLAPRRWSGQIQAPTSQSRGGYTSPDPSPTSDGHPNASGPNSAATPNTSHTGAGQLSIFTPAPAVGGGGMPISPDTPDAPEGPQLDPHAHAQAHAPYLVRPADASGGHIGNYFGSSHGRPASYTPLEHHHQHPQHHAQTHHGGGGVVGPSSSPSASTSASPPPPPPPPPPLGVSVARSLSMPYPSSAVPAAATIAVPAPAPAPLGLGAPPVAAVSHFAAQGMGQAVNHKPHEGIEVDPFYYPTMPHLHQHQPSYGYAHHLHQAHHSHGHAHAHAHPHAHQVRRSSIASGGPHGRRGSGKKADGKQQTFLPKLFQLLEQPEYHHIIRWDEAGEVIIIEKPDELTDKILPLVFRQTRFASFSRQLNIYGFMRKVSLRHVDRGICDPDASTWSHPFLRRNSDRDEIEGFKRRVPPRPSQAAKRRASIMTTTAYHEPTPGLSPTSSEASFGGLHPSPPDPYTTHLLSDVEEHKPSVFGQLPSLSMPRFNSHPHTHTQVQSYSYPHTYSSSPKDPSVFNSLGIGATTLTGAGVGGGGYLGQSGRPIAAPAAPVLSPPAAPFPSAFSAPSYFSRGMSAAAPVSAPANIHGFSPDLRISQGHVRTRSVQGEPPSAMIGGDFSPTSPLAQAAWAPEYFISPIENHSGGMDLDNAAEHERGHGGPHEQGLGLHLGGVEADGSSPEPALRGNGGTPTYDPDDPSTWIRRGWTDLATGAIVPPPAGRDMLGRQVGGGSPSSLPSDFAPGGGDHGYGHAQAHGPTYVSPVQSAFGTERPGAPLNGPELVRESEHPRGREYEEYDRGSRGGQDDMSPKTVSPGVYQAGFSLPALKAEPLAPPLAPPIPSSLSFSRSPRTPSKVVANRLDRRGSLSTSPYSYSSSPRTHQRPQLSLGPLPAWRPAGLGSMQTGINIPSLGSMPGLSDLAGLGLMEGSPRREGNGGGGASRRGAGGGGGGWERSEDVDEALPSAGLRGLMRGPFDGVLPVGGEEDAATEMA